MGSDAPSNDGDDDDDDDDRKTTKKKALASITINNYKPSLFDSPSSYFMAKGPEVQYDETIMQVKVGMRGSPRRNSLSYYKRLIPS